MTVFKGFLTITKRNLGYVFMYIIIFLTITIAVQKSELTDTDKCLNRQNFKTAVIDHDKSPVSEARPIIWLPWAQSGLIFRIPKLPFRITCSTGIAHYVLTILKIYLKAVKAKSESLTVTKVPGSTRVTM